MENNIFIFLIFICIFSEAIIIVFRKVAKEIRYILCIGSIPAMIFCIYNLRFMLDGISGVYHYINNPHASPILTITAVSVAIINTITFYILENNKKEV